MKKPSSIGPNPSSSSSSSSSSGSGSKGLFSPTSAMSTPQSPKSWWQNVVMNLPLVEWGEEMILVKWWHWSSNKKKHCLSRKHKHLPKPFTCMQHTPKQMNSSPSRICFDQPQRMTHSDWSQGTREAARLGGLIHCENQSWSVDVGDLRIWESMSCSKNILFFWIALCIYRSHLGVTSGITSSGSIHVFCGASRLHHLLQCSSWAKNPRQAWRSEDVVAVKI